MAVHDYLITDLNIEERYGKVWRLTRKMLISGLSTGAGDSTLKNALAEAPLQGTSPSQYPELVLVGRSAVMNPEDNETVFVNLEYERAGQSPENSIGTWFFSGGTALEQITTDKDLRAGGTGALPSLPPVYHFWPADDPDYGEQPQPEAVTKQGGEVTSNEPRSAFTATAILDFDEPGTFTEQWVGYINSDTWNGTGPGTWMCVSGTFEPFDLANTPDQYRFTLEFAQKREGWDPDYWFIDPRTGKPPPGIQLPCPPDPGDLCSEVVSAGCDQPGRVLLRCWYPRKSFCQEFGPCE